MSKTTAFYVRVSSGTQDIASQLPDLERWAKAQGIEPLVYKETGSGKTMDRPEWERLEDDIRMGKIQQLVVWRIDRLGRTASGLTALFDQLQELKVNFVSLKDSIDLSTSAGRLMANVLASVAQYEREVRGERQRAGIEVAKAKGAYKNHGRKTGQLNKANRLKPNRAKEMHEKGHTVTEIATALGVSRPTVYGYLRRN
jgi:DNA invertase Pin-like site-specific DNA recombinase